MDVFQSALRLVKRLLVVDAPAKLKAYGVEDLLRLIQEKAKMEVGERSRTLSPTREQESLDWHR